MVSSPERQDCAIPIEALKGKDKCGHLSAMGRLLLVCSTSWGGFIVSHCFYRKGGLLMGLVCAAVPRGFGEPGGIGVGE